MRFKQQKKIAVIGWLGAFNLGDEMMLDVSLGEFKRNGHEVTLLTHSGDKKVYDRYAGYAVVSRANLDDETVRSIADSNDALFVNGGALLDDNWYDHPGSLAKDIARLAKAFIRRKKKVLFYGVSTNDGITDPEFIRDFTYILEKADYVSVRDVFSRDVLVKSLGCTTAELVDDSVFADPRVLDAKPSVDGGRIVVVPLYNDETAAPIRQMITALLKVTNQPIRILHFFDEHNHDAIATNKLLASLGEERFCVDEIHTPRNAGELRASLEGADVVLSMRYHGILFASALGKRVVALHYDTHRHYQNKNTYLQKAYGYGKAMINISDTPSLSIKDLRRVLESAVGSCSETRTIHMRAKKSLRRVIKSI